MKEKEIERILKALANKRRLAIIKYLQSNRRASVGDVAEAIKLSFKATSKHLLILDHVDLVEKEQIGLTVIYFLSKEGRSVVGTLLSLFTSFK